MFARQLPPAEFGPHVALTGYSWALPSACAMPGATAATPRAKVSKTSRRANTRAPSGAKAPCILLPTANVGQSPTTSLRRVGLSPCAGSSQNPYSIAKASVRTLWVRNATEGAPMAGERQEAEQQHLLLMVESAQRAGRSESEISEIVDEAAEQDA